MLNYTTLYGLPQLRSYAEALAHFNDVKPIRGDIDNTKPVGRRDQKWLSIYMRDDKAVCIGSRWNKDKPLLAYYPDGRVSIEVGIGAACRERIQRIAGIRIQRAYNEDWVYAAAYNDGEAVTGLYPLKITHKRKPTFILITDKQPVYLNPVPVFRHHINRQEKAKLSERYKLFFTYVEAMAKLGADESDTGTTRDNPSLPTLSYDERKELGISVTTRWSDIAVHTEFLALLDSDNIDGWYKAMIWLSAGYYRCYLNDAKRDVENALYHKYRDTLFTEVKVEAGKCVADRYGKYFR